MITQFEQKGKADTSLLSLLNYVQFSYHSKMIRIIGKEPFLMKISTKGRYALRMMLEFAMSSEECTKLNQVAERQQISVKYLEQIAMTLSRAGFIKSMRGAQGGYRLARDPKDYTVGEVLRVMEGSLAPVPCLDDSPNQCGRAGGCAVLSVWKDLADAINQVVDHVTLADLVNEQTEKPEENLL